LLIDLSISIRQEYSDGRYRQETPAARAMEHLWSRADATNGNRQQKPRAARLAQLLANRCYRLPPLAVKTTW
jgi:hypothetical protein